MTNLSQLYTNQKNVAVAGTPEILPAQAVPPGIEATIKAKDNNTGKITIGYSSASALNSGSTCFKLSPGVAYDAQVQNTSLIWIDAEVSGEGVEIIFPI